MSNYSVCIISGTNFRFYFLETAPWNSRFPFVHRVFGGRLLRCSRLQRELGICLADLGAGSCDLIVFQQGAVAHTAVIPIGGDHFTSDLSVGMCTGLAAAETLKKNFGNAVPTLIPEGNEVEVPSVGDRPSRMMPQRMAGEILEPRARELFELLRDNLRHAGVSGALHCRICAERRSLAAPRHSRCGGIRAAESRASGLANANGEDAVVLIRARVRHRARHGA